MCFNNKHLFLLHRWQLSGLFPTFNCVKSEKMTTWNRDALFFAGWINHLHVFLHTYVENLLPFRLLYLFKHLWAVCWYSGICTCIGVPLTWIHQIAATFFLSGTTFKQMYYIVISAKNILTALLHFNKFILFSWFKSNRYQVEIILLASIRLLKR